MLFTFFLFFLVIVPGVFASDLVFTCSDSGCLSSNNSAIFSSSNLSPGEIVNKSVKLVNNTNQNKKFGIKVTNYSASGNLDLQIRFVITKISDNSVIWDDNFLQFANAGEVVLGDLPSNSAEDFNLTATFIQSSNNDFQGKSVNFDLEFGLIAEETSPSPTPTSTPESSVGSTGSNNDSGSTTGENQATGGVITALAASTYRRLFDEVATDNEILGIQQAATPSSGNSTNRSVSGRRCIISWWWLILALCYTLFSRKLRAKYQKNLFKKLLAAQVILVLIFVFLTGKFFCLWLLLILAVILGLLDVYRLAGKNN